MAYQHKTPDVVYSGSSKWLKVPDDYRPKDGETVIETDDVARKVQRNGFEITYLSYVFDLFDKLGGKKYNVVRYIMQHKSTDNTLIITMRELAEKSGVSYRTAVEAVRILKDAQLVQTRTGAIMLNPKLAHRGDKGKEAYLLQKFSVFDDGEE